MGPAPESNPKQALVDPRQALALLCVLLVAGALRTLGLDWGMPGLFHPDEWRVVDLARFSAEEIGVGSDYGALPVLILRGVSAVVSVIAELHYPANLPLLFLVGRFLSAFYEVATVALVYLIGKQAYGFRVGLLGALFLALSPIHIQQAHFATVDAALGLAATLALYQLQRLVSRPTWRSYLEVGACIGVALACKLTAAFLLPALVVVHLVTRRPRGLRGIGRELVSHQLLGGVGAALLVFVVLTPAALLHPTAFWGLSFEDPRWWFAWNFPEGTNRLLWNLMLNRGVVRPLWSLSSSSAVPHLHLLWLLRDSFGYTLTVLALTGVVVALVFRSRATIALPLFALTGIVLVGSSRLCFARYLTPLCPVLAVLAASFVLCTWLPRSCSPPRWLRVLRVAAVAVAVGAVGARGLGFARIYLEPDARLQAAAWIERNIPRGSTIAWEVDRFWAPFPWDRPDPRYRIKRWPLYDLYEHSTQHVYPTLLFGAALVPPRNRGQLRRAELERALRYPLEGADYVVLSNRFLDQYRTDRRAFSVENRLYDGLFDGSLGFERMKTFRVRPGLGGFVLEPDDAEHMFRVDHPTVWIFKRRTNESSPAELPR